MNAEVADAVLKNWLPLQSKFGVNNVIQIKWKKSFPLLPLKSARRAAEKAVVRQPTHRIAVPMAVNTINHCR